MIRRYFSFRSLRGAYYRCQLPIEPAPWRLRTNINCSPGAICGMLIGPLLADHPELIPEMRAWSTHLNVSAARVGGRTRGPAGLYFFRVATLEAAY